MLEIQFIKDDQSRWKHRSYEKRWKDGSEGGLRSTTPSLHSNNLGRQMPLPTTSTRCQPRSASAIVSLFCLCFFLLLFLCSSPALFIVMAYIRPLLDLL